MKYRKMDESKFTTYSKILCATLDRVRLEYLCENARKALQEYAESDYLFGRAENIDFENQLELWRIYNFLGDHPEPIEDKSVEIISHFLKPPAIAVTINGDLWWLVDWKNLFLLRWDRDWNSIMEEDIESLMKDNFEEFKDLWLRRETGEDISCERNFDLFQLACRLGFHIERLFENGDQLLVRLPVSGTDYQSYYNEILYNSLDYAR